MKNSFLPLVKQIKIVDYINEIQSNIENMNYLSALSLALIIPDICAHIINNTSGKKDYVKWFNKYVFEEFYNYDTIKNQNNEYVQFNGMVCYALRNAILHSGSTIIKYHNKKDKPIAKIDGIELCINSKSDIHNQFGESISIVKNNNNNEIYIKIRINIINFCKNMLKGCENFLIENNLDDNLFLLIDWDKKGTIKFVPSIEV